MKPHPAVFGMDRAWMPFLAAAAAVLLLSANSPGAPALPTLVSAEDVVAYVKYAPLDTVWSKLQAYANQVMPGKFTETDIRQLPPGNWKTPDILNALDLSKCVTTFIMTDGDKYAQVAYLPLKGGAGAAIQNNPSIAMVEDHLLFSSTPSILVRVTSHDAEFRAINEEPPMADARLCVNTAALQPRLKELSGSLGAMAAPIGLAAAADPRDPLSKLAEVGAVNLDIQLARAGVELQLNVFPKAGTELAKFCIQPPGGEFPCAAFLPGGGAIRAVWRLEIPSEADVFEPGGAREMLFPGKGPASMAQVSKTKDPAKAANLQKDRLTKQIAALGAKYEQVFTPGARQSNGVSVDKIDLRAALAKPIPPPPGQPAPTAPAPAAPGAATPPGSAPAAPKGAPATAPTPDVMQMLSALAPPTEQAIVKEYMLEATTPEAMDAMIGKVQAGTAQAAPLVARKTYPGSAQVYADVDLGKALQILMPLLAGGALLPGPKAPGLPALGNVSAPPLSMMAEMAGGAVTAKLFIPLDTARALTSTGAATLGASIRDVQTQAGISRTRTTLRTIGVALDRYRVDNNQAYPPSGDFTAILQEGAQGPSNSTALGRLTKPRSYFDSKEPDSFIRSPETPIYYYNTTPQRDPVLWGQGLRWVLWNPGPDGVSNIASKTDLSESKLYELSLKANQQTLSGDIIWTNKGDPSLTPPSAPAAPPAPKQTPKPTPNEEEEGDE